MIKRTLFRFSVLLAVGAGVAGCNSELESSRHLQAIPAKTMALMEEKGMRRQDPILVRIYKEDSKLEVWKKKASDGRYALLKEYDICRWSGTLGPKQREGDKQAPEGFYNVTPGQMNPKSSYYLSFNLGYPNAFDRSYGRTGAHLMVHGDCLSAGCYAMTDPQIAEVYALAREAFSGGQRSFQVHAMPFRMTPENLARRRDSTNIAFWKNLKEGSDHFEVTRLEPKVDVCERRYVFNADASGGRFEPSAACPEYQVQPSIVMAVAAKQRIDNQKFAELTSSGFQIAAAYVPQNGRVRRTLDEPIVRVAAVSPDVATTASSSPRLARVPLPAPRPVALVAKAVPVQQASSPTSFAWLRGGRNEAQPSAPVAAVSAPVAAAQPVPVPQPAEMSVARASALDSGTPFYRKIPGAGWLLGKGDVAPQQSLPASAPSPTPKPKGQRTADARY